MERKSKPEKPVHWRLFTAIGLAALGCGTKDPSLALVGLVWAGFEGKYIHRINSRARTIKTYTDIIGPPPLHDSEPVRHRIPLERVSHEPVNEVPCDEFVSGKEYEGLVDISEQHRRRLMRQAFEIIDTSGKFDVSGGQTEQIETIFINNPKM